jgi:hypothetical protein
MSSPDHEAECMLKHCCQTIAGLLSIHPGVRESAPLRLAGLAAAPSRWIWRRYTTFAISARAISRSAPYLWASKKGFFEAMISIMLCSAIQVHDLSGEDGLYGHA